MEALSKMSNKNNLIKYEGKKLIVVIENNLSVYNFLCVWCQKMKWHLLLQYIESKKDYLFSNEFNGLFLNKYDYSNSKKDYEFAWWSYEDNFEAVNQEKIRFLKSILSEL